MATDPEEDSSSLGSSQVQGAKPSAIAPFIVLIYAGNLLN